jgi:2-(1,2-epoxy-1,2-dihydrophenyl)acetyl-CoA isomerase
MGLVYSVDEGVATITLDRPDVLNAFDDDLGVAALDAVHQAVADRAVRCIALTGAGRAFSAGEDLAVLEHAYASGDPPDLGATLERRYNPLVRALRTAPQPVVAAVNGVAAGAGASLALACDFRLASERAKLAFSFAKVGLVPDCGALWFLARMVGTATAAELAMLGAPIDASDALRLGLFNRVVPAEDFERTWKEFARELATGPTRAFALTKRLLENAAHRSLDEQLGAEVSAQREAGRSGDHLEGVRAFMDKRPARFTGR